MTPLSKPFELSYSNPSSIETELTERYTSRVSGVIVIDWRFVAPANDFVEMTVLRAHSAAISTHYCRHLPMIWIAQALEASISQRYWPSLSLGQAATAHLINLLHQPMDLTILSVILALHTHSSGTRHLTAVGDASRFRVCRLCHHDSNLRPEINGNRLLEKFFNIIGNAGWHSSDRG
jgi:hypothetical protein